MSDKCGECYYWRTKGAWVVLAACDTGCSCPAAPIGNPPEDYIEIMFCQSDPSGSVPRGRSGFVFTFNPKAIVMSACVISRTGRQTWFYAPNIPPELRIPAIKIDENYICQRANAEGRKTDSSKDLVLVFGWVGDRRDQLVGAGQVEPVSRD